MKKLINIGTKHLKILALCTLLCAAVLIFHTRTSFACTPEPETSGSGAIVNYNPFDPNHTFAQLDFLIVNSGTTTCNLEVDLNSTNGRAVLFGPERLRFRVINGGGWNLNPGGRTLARIDVTIPAGQSLILTSSFRIRRNQIVEPGTYSQGIRIDVFDTALGRRRNQNIVSSNEHDFTATVNSHIEARVTDQSGNFNSGSNVSVLDAGILQTNDRHDIYLKIRGNTDAQVFISSQNGGTLNNVSDPSADPIDYTLQYRNRTYNMNSPILVTRSVPGNNNGVSDRMRYRIGNVENKLGGLYKDTFNVTVNAF